MSPKREIHTDTKSFLNHLNYAFSSKRALEEMRDEYNCNFLVYFIKL